jgi:nitroreductase
MSTTAGARARRVTFLVAWLITITASGAGWAQAPATIKLNAPDLERGLPFMETLSVKASAQTWSERELSLQDLSDLLWAANGINRPAEKKTTASSAQNAQDVDIYVFLKDGAYVYDVGNHALNRVASGDLRAEVTPPPAPRPAAPGAQPAARSAAPLPPVLLVLVSNTAKFRSGAPELRREWGAIDTGIVSQNISLFCAATGLKTRPRASMDRERVRALLRLEDAQVVFLNHPVGYAM